jgi:hypothetical protein
LHHHEGGLVILLPWFTQTGDLTQNPCPQDFERYRVAVEKLTSAKIAKMKLRQAAL